MEEGGTLKGIGLLPVNTVFMKNKNRTRVSGSFKNISGVLQHLSGCPVDGYEIHMGETDISSGFLELTDSVTGSPKKDGCSSGNVYGTYIHGIFDLRETVDSLINSLAAMKGIDPRAIGKATGREYKETQYNLLADALRSHMDIEAIYKIMEAGV